MIIDVDSHWEIQHLGPPDHPLSPWLDDLPKGVDLLAFAIAGDLLAALPESARPRPAGLLASLVAAAKERGGPVILHPQHHSTVAERVVVASLMIRRTRSGSLHSSEMVRCASGG